MKETGDCLGEGRCTGKATREARALHTRTRTPTAKDECCSDRRSSGGDSGNDDAPASDLLAVRLLLLVTLLDVEVAELVHVGLHRDHAQPVTDLVLLQELLCEVLEILLRETSRRRHNHGGAVPVQLHCRAERTSLAVHLYALTQEFLLRWDEGWKRKSDSKRRVREKRKKETNKCNHVEDLIFGGRGAINGAHHLGNGLHGLLQNHAHN